jgi:hypothetical protein
LDVKVSKICSLFCRKGNPVEETAELGEVTAHSDRPGYEPISSTLWRQREDYCARLIQGAWRRRGNPFEPDGGGLFNSILGTSRSLLDAVVEEENDELSDYELEPVSASEPVQTSHRSDKMMTSHDRPTIVVHSRSSSVSSTSIV